MIYGPHGAPGRQMATTAQAISFKTVFDAGDMGYATWAFPAFGLIFVCIGVLLVFKAPLMQRLMPGGLQGGGRRVFSWFYLIFSVIWTLVSFTATFGEYRRVTTELREGRYSVVEGRVTDFVPMPYTGHSEESFTVGGHRFSYSDYIVTSGFNN